MTPFKNKRIEKVISYNVYKRFINWVSSEFDLYLQQEKKDLKVYFPNGFFKIGIVKNIDKLVVIEILIKGKTEESCEKIFYKLEKIYNRVSLFKTE